MNPSLMNFDQAAESLKPMRVSRWTLKFAASAKTPAKMRLRVVRLGHRTVGIRQQDLAVWVARRAGEEI